MPDSVDDIDISPVGELAALKQERDRLDGYRSRADLMKDKVDAIVYRRVLEDYAVKYAELDHRSAPLTAKARTQYQALLVLERQVRTGFEEARLAKEELEFRYAVGELTDAELAERVEGPQQVLAGRQAELDAIAAIKAQFLSVVPSEHVLAAPVPSNSPDHVETMAPVAASRATPAPAAPAAPAASDANTRPFTGPAIAVRASTAARVSPPPPAAPRAPLDEDEPADRTFLVPDASLEPIDDSTDGARFRLGVITSIGRSAENHIRLDKAGVSRKHAVIRLTERGFALEDLGSQNGTFVNGTRVPQHDLVTGDVIWIGDVKVVFKSTWVPAGASAPVAPEGSSGSAVQQTRRGRRP